MVIQGSNPFHEKPIDAAFKVNLNKSEDASFKQKRTGKEKAHAFFQGVGKFGKKAAKGLGKGAKRINNSNAHNSEVTKEFINNKRKLIQAARVQHLRRKQEISEYKTNLLNLKHQKAIHKSNILSARVAAVEQKRALREAKRGNSRIAPTGASPLITDVNQVPRVKRLGPLSDRGYKPTQGLKNKRGPLSDRGGSAFKVNLKGRKKGGFFS